jgi:ribonuclease BN (tRNA processing enzyme)
VNVKPVSVTFLGTGSAFSDGGRHHSAYLIQSPKGSLLLDCGPTALASLKRLHLPTSQIDQILLSHFHGDHFAGLPFFFLEYVYVQPRSRPLVIAGPPGVEEIVNRLFETMYSDSASEPLPYSIEYIEALPDQKFLLGDIEINPFRVPHQNQPISLGFELLVEGRKIVYTGDSGWTEDFVSRTQGADLFLCECTFFETRLNTHIDYPRIIENLARLQAKRTILTHLGDEVQKRCREIDMELACDGLSIQL